MSEYLKVWIEGEAKPIITLLSMKKMEERLPDYFMRIHRSYIVNLTKIQEVNKNRIIMDADTYLPIGDIYKGCVATVRYRLIRRNTPSNCVTTMARRWMHP